MSERNTRPICHHEEPRATGALLARSATTAGWKKLRKKIATNSPQIVAIDTNIVASFTATAVQCDSKQGLLSRLSRLAPSLHGLFTVGSGCAAAAVGGRAQTHSCGSFSMVGEKR